MTDNRSYTSYNLYFIIPFLLWLVVGGVFLISYDKEMLFTSINNSHNHYLDTAMYYITHMGESIVIIPTLLLLPVFVKKFRNSTYFLATITANIGAFLLSQGLKSYFNEPRPLTYFKEAGMVHIIETWDHHYHRSFPSGHTTGAFALFCFLSMLLTPKYKAWGFLFFCLSMLVGYSRIYLAAHFFLDVYIGSLIGTIFSIFAVSLFYKTPYRPIY